MQGIDRTFLWLSVILTLSGLFIFSSAAMGLLTRDGATFTSVAVNQIGLGLILGLVAFAVAVKIPYTFWRRYAFYIFIFSLVVSILVFVPHIGIIHGGAKRWIDVFGLSFQPSELLKIGVILYFAAWLTSVRKKISDFKFGLLPLTIIIAIVGVILLKQPDTDTFLVIFLAILGMYLAGGGRWRDILILLILAVLAVGVLAMFRPYLLDRITTFIDPTSDPLGSGYQIQQSLIAIGSGGLTGRGFGQSIQKFNYLPEPIGDSIFAVAGEEFGFIGCFILIALFVLLSLRGLRIADRASDSFGGLTVVGIVILIVSQSFFNIASMLAVLPLSGTPLLFVSHGGTALAFTLGEIGLVLNISKHQRRVQKKE
jgi:cell division protein FtsW